MPDLREQLETCFQGRVCLVGVGSPDQGDDGFGVRLAAWLEAQGQRSKVLAAGTAPERFLTELSGGGFDHVIFLDAVECGGAPGSVVFLDRREMAARYPQISTHRISLGTIAQWVEAGGTTQAWLLGVQPESLRPRAGLTPAVQKTLETLAGLLREVEGGGPAHPRIANRPLAFS
jgi:hydrogenase maturation protease